MSYCLYYSGVKVYICYFFVLFFKIMLEGVLVSLIIIEVVDDLLSCNDFCLWDDYVVIGDCWGVFLFVLINLEDWVILVYIGGMIG